jgi:hypothetical protein
LRTVPHVILYPPGECAPQPSKPHTCRHALPSPKYRFLALERPGRPPWQASRPQSSSTRFGVFLERFPALAAPYPLRAPQQSKPHACRPQLPSPAPNTVSWLGATGAAFMAGQSPPQFTHAVWCFFRTVPRAAPYPPGEGARPGHRSLSPFKPSPQAPDTVSVLE